MKFRAQGGPDGPIQLDARSGLRHIAVPSTASELLVDRLATLSDCWQRVAYCSKRADAATDEQVRALWISMAQFWINFAQVAEPVGAAGGHP